jgi:hypothetical protein
MIAACLERDTPRTLGLDDRYFASVISYREGDLEQDIIFHFHQQQGLISATYEGGGIRFGTLLGRFEGPELLDMRYQHLAGDGALASGGFALRAEVLADGRYRLHGFTPVCGAPAVEEIRR